MILDCAFNECRNLKTVNFPYNSELHAMYDAFGFTAIKTIKIPSLVTYLNAYFKGCSHLKTIIFDSNSQIKSFCISCEELLIDKICIPSSVEKCSFPLLKNLKTVIIPPDTKLKEIGSFKNTAIEKITIPSQVEKLGNSCFYKCCNLKNVIFQLNSKLKNLPNFFIFIYKY